MPGFERSSFSNCGFGNLSTNVTTSVVPVSSLRSRFQTGIAYNTIGATLNQGSTLAVNIIVAHLVGRQAFGEYAIVQSTLLTLAVIAQLGTGYTATKYVAEFRSIDKARTGRILGLLLAVSTGAALAVSIVLLGSARWLSAAVLKAPDLRTALAIASGVLVFSAINGFLMGALAGLEGYRRLARALIPSGVSCLVICTVLAWWSGLNGTIAGLLLSALIQWVLLRRALKQECAVQEVTVSYKGIAKERSIILRFALPGAMSGFTSMPALWVASTFLVRQPNGYSEMALYSAAYTLMTAVLFLPNITNNVGMSLINNQKGQGDLVQYQRTFWVNVVMTAGAVLVGASALALVGSELLRLFGKDFARGYRVLLILAMATVPQGLAIACYQLIPSREKMWLSLFAVSLPRDAIIVALAYVLIPRYGAVGFASAYTISWTLALLSILCIVYKMDFQIANSKFHGPRRGTKPNIAATRSEPSQDVTF